MHPCSAPLPCLTLCDPMDCNPPGSSVLGISQERILDRAAISSSKVSSWPRDGTRVSCISCIGRQILYWCTTWEALSTRVNPKINGGLWGIMTYQYRFISCNKCISLVQGVDNAGGCTWQGCGGRGVWELCAFLLQCFCEPKTTLKII